MIAAGRLVAAGALGLTATMTGTPSDAWSAPSNTPSSAPAPSARLCSDDDVQCSVQVPSRWLDGTTQQVGLTGKPRTKVQVQAYRIGPAGLAGTARAVNWTPLGSPHTITTDAKGWGSADLTLPRLGSGEPGGPVVVALTGSVGDPLDTVLGAWTELTGAAPELVGDGFDVSKPVGRPLTMVLDHAIVGTRFAVEREENGAWIPVPADDGAAAPDAETRCEESRCTLTYVVPRGLPATTHRFRIVDLDTSLPAGTWTVEPHVRGVAQARTAAEVNGPLGTAIPGSLAASLGEDVGAVVRPRSRNVDLPEARTSTAVAETVGHPGTWVKVPSALAAVLALALALAPSRHARRAR